MFMTQDLQQANNKQFVIKTNYIFTGAFALKPQVYFGSSAGKTSNSLVTDTDLCNE